MFALAALGGAFPGRGLRREGCEWSGFGRVEYMLLFVVFGCWGFVGGAERGGGVCRVVGR